MREVAGGVWQIALTPRNGVNAWLLGDVLVDAGTAGQGRKLPDALAGRSVAAHAITHAHPDHIGGSAHVCRALGVPFWAPAGDAAAARAGMAVGKESPLKPLLDRGRSFAPLDVARELREGDDVAGFRVLDVPGHSPGHIALWRESDRVLVAGDVWFNLSLLTFRYGLRQPPGPFTVDPPRNRDSMRRLAALEPSIACFGHGPPVTGAGPKLRAFVARLPR
ncbi:MAG TPA: MBL fold metallo-hydrolase [Solirubrobacteraceae bacterium]|jgi:glyoxylase-like metal-dependent hydrolase (beta-lactamase superfamily II)|nr:MBL fold metallo-hydrolase [Solirubrobacteraceae bacterium]